jgi:synaptobrevin family protein YKT6
MKVLSIIILDSNLKEQNSAFSLQQFNYFYRNDIKNAIIDGSKIIAGNSEPGLYYIVGSEEISKLTSKYNFKFHCYNKNNIIITIVVDDKYPINSVKCIIKDISNKNGNIDINKLLDISQKPENVDKLAKITKEIDEIKIIMHENIENLIKRGENLKELDNRTDELLKASIRFEKKARDMNKCCKIL